MPRFPDLPCADCGELMWRSSTSLPEGQACCRSCRKRRTATSSCGTYAKYRQGCRCSDCRSAATAKNREWTAARFARTGQTWPSQQTRANRPAPRRASCADCGKPLRRSLLDVPRCNPCHHRERDRVERIEARRKRASARVEIAARGSQSSSVWTQGDCRLCGEPFTRRGSASPYCSRLCSRRDKPTGAKFKIRRTERLAIYERDGWVCQLCHEPVSKDLPPLDDWAPSLDHIECQSWALIPDHSPANLRLAHRWCNSVRGDETWFTEADLRVSA